jgi:phospholipid transport system substrate-binding protein
MFAKRLFAPLAFFVLVLAGTGLPAAQAQSADDAKKMVQHLANRALTLLADPNVSREKREAEFHKLFVNNFHVRSIAVFVLGRPWRLATPAQRKAYLDVFEKFIVKTYNARLSKYAGETFKIIKATGPDERGVYVVDSEIIQKNKAPIPLNWTIRKSKHGLRIVDIVIENLSMAQTQRDDFAAILRRRGSIDGLIAALKEKMKELDAS